MVKFKFISGVCLYFFSSLALIFITIFIKILALKIADNFIYNIYILGDFLQGIDIVEAVNIIVFAILGIGFGLISCFIPKNLGEKTGAICLIILFPIIFSTTNFIRYHNWLVEVADVQNISYQKAKIFTNSFLADKVGSEGFLGFYVYTAQFPSLPKNTGQIKELNDLEKTVRSRLLEVILKATNIQPQLAVGILAIGNWGLRLFYLLISLFITITHFWKGLKEAGRIPI